MGLGFSEIASWSRAARRHASKIQEDKTAHNSEQEFAFGFKIIVEPTLGDGGSKICIRWVKGNDSVIFESFCGMLKRKVEE